MKNALIITLFLTMSLTAFAQQKVSVNNEIEFVEANKVEKTDAKAIDISAKIKSKVLKMNRKKSNEIISIKAYRKSLQIKVKTVKFC
ncbi:hypothetical protein [Winogradskyella bathintestinalis]|uniref:Uncharacterized protein n=1 Tax=Winogradskyella bathintestinalis TaxID=3035208 RepID=A0ABT7ZQ16_9FLAO|nr:hypothetical protein [Winogradskyella bathintestinalis]MDN3491115.1 hypothetical protein [Winogradskyella bathintestinalis]